MRFKGHEAASPAEKGASSDGAPLSTGESARRDSTPTMIRVEDVAARWGLNVKTLYGMIERGELPARRFGRILRIPRAVVESYEQASVAPGAK